MKGEIFIMAKKKKKKKIAKKNLAFLSTGEIKISKKNKLDIGMFAKPSIDNAIVERLGKFISKEDIVIDSKEEFPIVRYSLSDTSDAVKLFKESRNAINNPTVVIPIAKKHSMDAFDLISNNPLSTILRTSTLSYVYKEFKETWAELNKDIQENVTNIMFVPNVQIIIDEETGKFLKTPITLNVLIVSLPKQRTVTNEGLVDVDNETKVSFIIHQISEAIITCGVKNVIFDPYSHKDLNKNKGIAIEEIKKMFVDQRFKDNVRSVTFCIENENEFISFSNLFKKVFE